MFQPAKPPILGPGVENNHARPYETPYERGIGYVVNGLVSAEDGEDPYRTPSHVAHLNLLDATRLGEAIGVIITGGSC